MKNLRRILAAVLMTLVIGFGAFAQKNDNERRPPKDGDNKVKVREKERQPQNNDRGNNNKKGNNNRN
jgi:hypothetical protein